MNRALPLAALSLLSVFSLSIQAAEDHAGHAASSKKAIQAVADVQPTKDNTAKGTVLFIQDGGKVKVIADITGLKPNTAHGFHIHEGSEIGDDGMKAGGHYNPDKHQHAGPDTPQRHAGDLGNLKANADGKAHLELTLEDISINGHHNPIVGRTVIVHAQPDDYKTQPTGNSGARIAGGVIKLKD